MARSRDRARPARAGRRTMKSSCEMHVISNTHWDASGARTFRNAHAARGTLDALRYSDTETATPAFCWIPGGPEDYLEVRPECRDRITKHVTMSAPVGPWYTCPKSCVNGSRWCGTCCTATASRAFGQVMKVGYSPFSYGQTSQMPQIYAGFGIVPSCFTMASRTTRPQRFIFEGADGTRVRLAIKRGGAVQLLSQGVPEGRASVCKG